MDPATPEPTRQQLLDNLNALYERTMTLTEKAASLGVSEKTMRRMVGKGEVEVVVFGREHRVWADA
jgi:excisionase family DNA binding protein